MPRRLCLFIAIVVASLILNAPLLAAHTGAGPVKPPKRVEVVRLSRSHLGYSLYHCIKAGLQSYKSLQVVEHDADWQVKIAVTSRPFLDPYSRLVHLVLLHRAEPQTASESTQQEFADNAFPSVEGYQIDSTVIRVVPSYGFADTCHSIVTDLVSRHLAY